MRYDYSHSGVTTEVLEKGIEGLKEYQIHIAQVRDSVDCHAPEAAVAVPFDEVHRTRAHEIAARIGRVKHVVLVGIGGSSMGTLAAYGALKTAETPTLHVLDVLDGEQVTSVVEELKTLSISDFAIVVISKSGSTTETLANADVLLSRLRELFGNEVHNRTVCIGNAATPLQTVAQHTGMQYANIPEMVGGRFSIFSAVGLVPFALLGFDIDAFLLGARRAFTKGTEAGSAAAYAGVVLAEHIRQSARVYALFTEHDRLAGFGAWYQQLLAESLGKVTKEGVKTGIAPVCMSPRELHSTAQLYLSGFPGVLTHFIGLSDTPVSPYTISEEECGSLVSITGVRDYERLPNAIMHGVHAAYVREGLPHVRIEMDAPRIEGLGALMAEKMIEVMYVAHLLGIDAFDQPHVELYKKETRKILESNAQ